MIGASCDLPSGLSEECAFIRTAFEDSGIINLIDWFRVLYT